MLYYRECFDILNAYLMNAKFFCTSEFPSNQIYFIFLEGRIRPKGTTAKSKDDYSSSLGFSMESKDSRKFYFIYLFGVLCRFQHYTGHITTGSWKGRGNQYIQFARVVYCKLPTNGKQLPAFSLKAVTGIEPWPQRWEASVTTLPPLPLKILEKDKQPRVIIQSKRQFHSSPHIQIPQYIRQIRLVPQYLILMIKIHNPKRQEIIFGC